jgi:putative sugar O-methyltransferase
VVATFEHVTREQGAQYLELVRRDNPALLAANFERYRANDLLGGPVRYEYPGIGSISPVTLRYMKVLSDLERHFGDLSGKRIVEVGGAYGGQARLIMERWRVESYTLVDLEPVLRLARRYLSTSGPYPEMNFVPPTRVVQGKYDLCISNYAFSELTSDVQDVYGAALVAPADRGYLTCNFIRAVHGIGSWSKERLAMVHQATRWLPEEPLTFEGNAILVWGDFGGVGIPEEMPGGLAPRSVGKRGLRDRRS